MLTRLLTRSSPLLPLLSRSTRLMSTSSVGLDVLGAKAALKSCDCVCFDVDSTVITEEGIDVLAEFLGEKR